MRAAYWKQKLQEAVVLYFIGCGGVGWGGGWGVARTDLARNSAEQCRRNSEKCHAEGKTCMSRYSKTVAAVRLVPVNAGAGFQTLITKRNYKA